MEQGWQQLDSIMANQLVSAESEFRNQFSSPTNLKLWVTSGNSHLKASIAWQGGVPMQGKTNPKNKQTALNHMTVVSRNIKRLSLS